MGAISTIIRFRHDTSVFRRITATTKRLNDDAIFYWNVNQIGKLGYLPGPKLICVGLTLARWPPEAILDEPARFCKKRKKKNLPYLHQSNFSFILLCDYQKRNKTTAKGKGGGGYVTEIRRAEGRGMTALTHTSTPLRTAWLVCAS